MNLEDPAFADVNVRKALSLAIDRDYVANTLMQGTYSPAYNLVGEGW
jgi:oligopeptide transport system substrate-binding protein